MALHTRSHPESLDHLPSDLGSVHGRQYSHHLRRHAGEDDGEGLPVLALVLGTIAHAPEPSRLQLDLHEKRPLHVVGAPLPSAVRRFMGGDFGGDLVPPFVPALFFSEMLSNIVRHGSNTAGHQEWIKHQVALMPIVVVKLARSEREREMDMNKRGIFVLAAFSVFSFLFLCDYKAQKLAHMASSTSGRKQRKRNGYVHGAPSH